MEKVKFKKPLSSFSQTLKERVDAFMATQDLKRAARYEVSKACALLVSLFVLYGSLFFLTLTPPVVVLILLLMSLNLYACGTNIFHESMHGNVSRSPRLNRLFGYGFDIIIAISSEQYLLTHTVLHHTFTNMHDLDGDLGDGAMVRLSPHQSWQAHHRYQGVYAPFLYTLIFITWGPVYDLSRLLKNQISAHQLRPWSKKQMLHQLSLKAVHYALFLGLPMFFYSPWIVLLCYLFVHMISGLIVTLIFQIAHVNGESKFIKLETDKGKHLSENDFFVHQLLTSANFANQSRFMNFISGGLNFQTEHHLFPNISYYFYPEISQIVRKTCEEYDLPYVHFQSFAAAAWAHVKLLHELGQAPQSESMQVS